MTSLAVLDALRPPWVTDLEPAPPTPLQAAALAPLMTDPPMLRDTWAAVLDEHPCPTVAQVAAVVARRADVYAPTEGGS